MKKSVFFTILITICTLSIGQIPVITLISPSSTDNIDNSGLILLEAEIVSSSPLIKFSIIHNRVTIVNEKSMMPEKADDVTYIIRTNIPLKKGVNTVHMKATNSYGTAISEKRVIDSHLEPFIIWLSPVANNIVDTVGIIDIKVVIKTDYELLDLRININGNESDNQMPDITYRNDSTYIFEKSVRLTPEMNSIYLTASNAKGVTRSFTRIVYYGSESIEYNKNVIYGTLGIGPIYGTLLGNYEHMILERAYTYIPLIGIRMGAGAWVSWGTGGIHCLSTLVVLSGRKKSHFELGLGTELLNERSSLRILPAGNLGYRFQNLEKQGGVIRIGIGFPEGLYLSVGFNF